MTLIELAQDGVLTWESIARACMSYMSEEDVADMARINELIEDEGDADWSTVEEDEMESDETESDE